MEHWKLIHSMADFSIKLLLRRLCFTFLLIIRHSIYIKAHFAGNNRKSQDWNIICSPLSIRISHYLQIQRVEISFSARHQGVNGIFALKSMTVSSFSDCQKHEDITVRWSVETITVSLFCLYYTWRNGLRLYNCMTLAMIIIMFI